VFNERLKIVINKGVIVQILFEEDCFHCDKCLFNLMNILCLAQIICLSLHDWTSYLGIFLRTRFLLDYIFFVWFRCVVALFCHPKVTTTFFFSTQFIRSKRVGSIDTLSLQATEYRYS